MKDEYRKLSVELFGICDTVKNAKSKRLNLNQNIDWDDGSQYCLKDQQ